MKIGDKVKLSTAYKRTVCKLARTTMYDVYFDIITKYGSKVGTVVGTEFSGGSFKVSVKWPNDMYVKMYHHQCLRVV